MYPNKSYMFLALYRSLRPQYSAYDLLGYYIHSPWTEQRESAPAAGRALRPAAPGPCRLALLGVKHGMPRDGG